MRDNSSIRGYIRIAGKSKDAENVKLAFKHFAGKFGEAQEVYTDSAGEYQKGFRLLNWNGRCARPHRPQTNGVAERAVRRVTEATRCALCHSQLPMEFWDRAMRCSTTNHNATYIARNGQTPYEIVHKKWPGAVFASGQAVEYQYTKYCLEFLNF